MLAEDRLFATLDPTTRRVEVYSWRTLGPAFFVPMQFLNFCVHGFEGEVVALPARRCRSFWKSFGCVFAVAKWKEVPFHGHCRFYSEAPHTTGKLSNDPLKQLLFVFTSFIICNLRGGQSLPRSMLLCSKIVMEAMAMLSVHGILVFLIQRYSHGEEFIYSH